MLCTLLAPRAAAAHVADATYAYCTAYVGANRRGIYSILLQGVGAHGGVQIKLLRKHLHHVAEVSLAAESFMIYLRKTRT